MNGPRPLAASLDAFARVTGAPSAKVLDVVFSRWSELVGPVVAAHAAPVSLRGGILVVGVDQPAWATAMRSLAGDVLRRLAAAAGEPVATQLEVRVRRAR